MKNFDIKNAAIITAVVLGLGGVGLYFYNPSQNIDNAQVKQVQEKEFGGVDVFVKKDLTTSEKEDLKIILEQRKEKLKEMEAILNEAYNGGDMEMAWIKVNDMRSVCKNRILPFIADNKKGDFEVYCYEQASEMDSKYVQK